MQVEVTPEETAVLIRWKERTDNYVLVRMKAEAILCASRGVDVGIIAEMVERSAKTIREWLADWQNTRMCSVLTGHAGNRNAAELTRARKEDLEAVLALPPSRSGIDVEFWDVPALRDVVKILFDVKTQVNHLLEAGWEVYAVDEVRLGERGRDPPHVATQGAAHQVLRGPAESVPVVLRCLVFD